MRVFLLVCTVMWSASFCACTPDGEELTPPPAVENPGGEDIPGGTQPPEDTPQPARKMRITAGTASFTATLTENRAFASLLPMTVGMNELNGNEKYYYLPDHLPTSPSRPGTIRSGDIMLYGSNCLVLFYKTFSTSYSYTKIGSVDYPSALEAALGKGSVTVKFELINE